MFSKFILKSFIKSKLKGVPDQDIDRIIAVVEKNPDFFKQMGEELQKLTASGMSQEDAVKKIFAEHKNELQGIIGNQ